VIAVKETAPDCFSGLNFVVGRPVQPSLDGFRSVPDQPDVFFSQMDRSMRCDVDRERERLRAGFLNGGLA
jgi:hypothetical protein